MHGDVPGMRKAIEKGADVDVKDGRYKISALSFGAYVGSTGMVELLLDRGADPCNVDKLGILPIHRAARGVKGCGVCAGVVRVVGGFDGKVWCGWSS